MIPVIPLLLLLTMLSLPALAASTQQEQTSSNGLQAGGLEADHSADCMRCHQMATLAYRDRETGKVVNLSIQPESYTHSSHRALACGDCHHRSYQSYPHRLGRAEEALSCVGCHREQAKARQEVSAMEAINDEYQRSVHAALEVEEFSCFSCHNAHSFRPEPTDAPPAQRVAANNGLCLDCHSEQRGEIPVGHDWLPRPRDHWRAVRCVDCHSPVNGPERVSHRVLSGADSARHCIDCHTKDSRLLNQLYSWRSEQALTEQGFFKQALYNDAYIVGMSRNDQLDRFSLGVLALVLLGILAHGTGRWLSYRKRNK